MAKSSVFRTCHPEELEGLTRGGWALKSILSQEKTIDVLDEVVAWDKGNDSNGGGYYRAPGWQHTTVPRKAVAAETLFLLELNESSAVAELEEKVKKAQQELAARDVRIKEHEKKATEYESASAMKDRHAQSIAGQLDAARKDATSLREAKNRLESDLAKIQRAVGDLRYQEIVGGPVPK